MKLTLRETNRIIIKLIDLEIFESKIKRKGYRIVGEWTLGQPHKSARSSSSCQKQQAPCLFMFVFFFENRFSSKLRTWMNEWMNWLEKSYSSKSINFKWDLWSSTNLCQSNPLNEPESLKKKKKKKIWLGWKNCEISNPFGHLIW